MDQGICDLFTTAVPLTMTKAGLPEMPLDSRNTLGTSTYIANRSRDGSWCHLCGGSFRGDWCLKEA